MASNISGRQVAACAGPGKSAPLVLGLNEVGESQCAVVGGKVANLAVLFRAGMPVPHSFCVTTTAFGDFLASFPGRTRLSELLPRCSVARVDQLAELSREAQSCLASSVVPPPVRDAVLAAWRGFGHGFSCAVRSSATAEDAPERSFAGQFESFLNVRGEEALVGAIKSCWLSLFSERVLVYLVRQSLPVEEVQMAVLVQEMVAADFSGVAFTADPISGATDRLVVEWVPGLGDLLVQGTREPKRMVIGKKTHRVLEPVNARNLMPEAIRRRLLELAAQTERLFRAPQDIEWACRDGQVWLLQARPITTLRRSTEAEVEIWSNLNAVENLPDVATPLTWSILELTVRRHLGPLLKIAGVDPATEGWLGLVAGRVYMNVGVVLRILRCLPGFRRDRLAWLLGGHQDDLMDTLERQTGAASPSLRARTATLLRVLRLAAGFLSLARWRSGRACLAWLTAWVDGFERLDCQELSVDDLFARLNSAEADFVRHLPVPVMFGTGLIFHGLFRRGCRKWFQDSHGALANRLLSRAGGMASAEPAIVLWQMAVSASQQASLRAAVQAARNFAELADLLSSTAAGKEILGQWNAFMRRHGHHASGEVDIATPRWSERPDDVLRLVQGFLESAEQCDPSRILEARTRERERVLAECGARLRNPLKRWWFNFLLHRTQEWVVFRENVKSETIRGLAAFRRIFLELGDQMARQGMLECRDDIFFLTVEEYEAVYRGAATFDVRAVIRARRAEFERNRAITPPAVIVGRFDPARQNLAPDYHPGGELRGLPVSAGIVTGPARVILRADGNARILPGEILIAPCTDPAWTPYFLTAAGLVTDIGGQLSHGSVIAREYGLPAIVNVPSATKIIHTGDLIRVDGDTGSVSILVRGLAGGSEEAP
ncbi:MAG: PEP/pyruvate-binding domain-containing protein [Limisphaerales bacterium]